MRFRLSPVAAFFIAAVACAPLACSSVSLSAGAHGGAGGTTGASGSGAGPSATGAGGGDASIDIAQDGTNPAADPTKPFADLCGKGCSPGADPDGCGPLQGPTGGGEKLQSEFCQIVPADDGVAAVCGSAGNGDVDAPCQSVSDCAAGLGCVATENGGQCRPYCCGDVEACPAHTFCAPKPMIEDPQTLIPVCAPADDCQLLDDSTCCPGGDGTCDLTCTIVRNDGTTSCVVPGTGMLGDACPCAAGYICTKLTNECKKLCHLGQDAIDCAGGGTCQGGLMGYPAGIGVCVGGAEKSY